MTDPFTTVATELPRDRWGRPLITPPGETEAVPYMRTTTFVGVLEDRFHLEKWQQRMVVYGTSLRKDIQLAASALRDPSDRFQKKELNKLAERAIEAAQGSSAATTGTALHTFTEEIDRGREPAFVPDEYAADLQAYRRITEGFEFLDIEGFCVRDDIRVGGSYDRIARAVEPLIAPDGSRVDSVIWDLKTGGSVDGGLFGMGKISMQLGVYANSVVYDHTLGSRSPLPGDPSKTWGIVCHLPAGSGQATLLWVDIASGWEVAYEVAPRVHAWRKRRDLSTSFRVETARPREISLPEEIAKAPTLAALYALHDANRLRWTPGLTSLAAKRKAELEGISA